MTRLTGALQVLPGLRSLVASPFQSSSISRSLRSKHFGTQVPDLNSMDTIKLTGLTFHGYHGVLPEEKILGQKFKVDTTLYCGINGLRSSGNSDDVKETVNYADTYRLIEGIVEGKSLNLIETVAAKIASAVLQSFPLVQTIRVQVSKPHVCIPGSFENISVEIVRHRSFFRNASSCKD